jgi:hypothetical protein
MQYAQTGIAGYAPPGGACAGHRYEDRPDQADRHMSVNCPRCEPWLAKDPLWSGSPATVPPNELEKKAASEATADRERAVLQTAASTAASIGDITLVLGALVDRLDAMQSPQAAVAVPAAPAVPEVAAPVSGTPEPVKAPVKPRSRKVTAGAAA